MKKIMNKKIVLFFSISLFFLGTVTASASIEDSISTKGILVNESPKTEEVKKEKPPLKEQKTIIKKDLTYPKTGFAQSLNGTVIGLFLVMCSMILLVDRMHEAKTSKKSE